jgi:hypothetical protein
MVKYIKRKERLELVGFNDFKFMLVLIPFFAFFFPLMVFGLSPLDDPFNFFLSYLISIAHIAVYWYVERWIVIYIRKKYAGIMEKVPTWIPRATPNDETMEKCMPKHDASV